jgi:dihydroorotase
MKIHIKGGRLLSKRANLDTVSDLFIADGQIVGIGALTDFTAEKTLDAQNQLVVNGLVDLTANCLDSSFAHHKRYLEEASVAAKSGVTTLCIPPDTSPIIDNAAVVELIQSRTESACCEILPIASMTQQLQGQHLTFMSNTGFSKIEIVCLIKEGQVE